MNILNTIKNVMNLEIEGLLQTINNLDENLSKIVELISRSKGKLVISGMGKSGHIAKKLSATFSSLGIPSFFLHPAEGLHGDLGSISSEDIILLISYSGQSIEITSLIPTLKKIGITIITISGNEQSYLCKNSDFNIILPKISEADHLNLAPTTTTTCALVLGDSIAVAASKLKGFRREDFGVSHPAGSLGKELLYTVRTLMIKGNDISILKYSAYFIDALNELTEKGIGIVLIGDEENDLVGIITDGQINRHLNPSVDIYNETIESLVIKDAIYINDDAFAIDALKMMNQYNIKNLPVKRNDNVIGIIRKKDILDAGIYDK
jgi:arabinose-5-phosphate isomerase